MPRQQKPGLSYFPLDVDFFTDNKIRILRARFGNNGIAVYIYLLCEIYKKGYYMEWNDDFKFILAADLNLSDGFIEQVLTFLLERSLLDSTLFKSDTILTSPGIQKRYQLAVKERAKKTPVVIKGFWLLEADETEPFIKVNPSLNSSEKKSDFSEKKEDNSEKNNTKGKEKKKEYIDIDTAPPDSYFSDDSLNKAFLLFLKTRREEGARITEEQVKLLKEDLKDLSTDPREMEAIVRKATVSGWKSFYPIKKQPAAKKKEKKTVKNTFNAFPQRDNDFDALERTLNE